MTGRLIAPLLLALSASACVSSGSYYHWGSYNETLYGHYKRPLDRQAWIEGLKTTILEAEQEGEKVPPGIYAEYGYALFEEGNAQQAVVYYRKEADLWPEARFFMEKMIRNAEQRGVQPKPPTVGPAGALEKS
jgi:hypothetical protein